MNAQVQYRDVCKQYPRAQYAAVNCVSLEVYKGEMLALVGESGSGKTTLLRLAAGLEIPTGGEIFINGKLVAGTGIFVPPEKRRLGMIFQEGALFPHLNIEANIAYGISANPYAERKEAVGEMLELVGLAGYQKRFPHELSGGERQRVALARALAPKPEVIFLDEPFSSLDATLRRSLRDEVCTVLKKMGATAVLVVHDPEDALSVGERIAVLRKGFLEQVSSATDAYYRPTSEYCARLFGPANAVDVNGKTQWLRPEQFSICEQNQARVSARIMQARNVGRYWEMNVSLETAQAQTWLIQANLSYTPNIGEQIGISWR